MRLSLKLPLVYTLLIATLGGAFVGLTSHMVEGAMEGEEEEYFEGLTRFFALNGATAVVLKDYAALSTLVDNMAEAEHVRYVAILDATGRVLAHSDHAQEGRVPDTSLERRAAQATGLLVQRPGENLVDVTAPLTIAGRKWGAARIGFSQDDLRVKIAGAQLLILGIGGGVVLLGALTVLLIARRITGPLGQLHWGAEAFRRGDLGHRVPDRAGDELGDLARAFNDMARDLAAHYGAIEHAKQEWESTFDAVSDALFIHDAEMRILRCNRAYARAAGLGYGQIVGRPYYQVFPRTCEPMTGCAQTVEHDANGDGVEDFTLEDQGRSFRVKCYAIRNPVGAFLHALHVLEDVTEHRRAEQEIRDLLMAALTSLAHAIEAKSPWTRGHSERVTQYTVQIGEALGLPEDELAQLRIAALLHDIGKIGTADGLLDKPDRLTPEEYETIKLHPATGAGMLSPIKQLHPIIPWVRGHHERYDGNGYPDGLAGEAIPLQARILAVADTFDAMTAERPYRATPGRERAIHELRQNAGSQLDPQVVAAFLLVLDEGPDRHFRAA